MSNLKPCPNAWCKSTDIVDSHDGADHKRYMRCDDCYLQGPYGTKETIVELWNAMADDHVSKSELRAWCEEMMPFYVEGTQLSEAARGSANILNLLLEKFCKGEK